MRNGAGRDRPIEAGAASRTILYFCYGAPASYDQALFSILSLLRVGTADARVVVYCDRPAAFAALPVETVELDKAMLAAWLGGSDYIHRRKTCVIIDALARYGGKVVFLDTDTYWIGSPAAVFARVGPGRACFHIKEGYLLSTGTPSDAALVRQLRAHEYQDAAGAAIVADRLTPMWNTGVVGIDAADADLIVAALTLSDRIWADADPEGAYGHKIHHAEQFAMGYVFRHCRLGEAADLVYHYWPQAAKTAFGQALPDLVASGLADRSAANLERLYRMRYRRTGRVAMVDRLKMRIRRAALAMSAPIRGVRLSV